jgi:putative transposase
LIFGAYQTISASLYIDTLTSRGQSDRVKQGAKTASIRAKECFKRAVNALGDNLEIAIRGKLSQQIIFETVVGMASNQESIHSISHNLEDIPCETSLRHHLKKLDFGILQDRNVEILTSRAISILNKKKAYKFAVDFTLDPYYGKETSENSEYIVRSQKKKSTNDFCIRSSEIDQGRSFNLDQP